MLLYVRIKLGHFVPPGKSVFLVLPLDYLADNKMLNVMRIGKINHAKPALTNVGNLFPFAKLLLTVKNFKCTVKVNGVSVFQCKCGCHVCYWLTAVCTKGSIFALKSPNGLFVMSYLFGSNCLGRNKMLLLLGGRIVCVSSVFVAGTILPVVAPVF